MAAGAPALTVLVDGRNVLRSRWPNIPEAQLVELCSAWAEAHDVLAVVVFDREAPGGLVGEEEQSAHLRLVGTGGESADDWLARAAAALRDAGDPFWLVTSDRQLRVSAGTGAEKVIGGGSFAGELSELP